MGEQILKVDDLRVSFHTYAGEVQAVRGVSFTLDKGEALALVGESGCGKSVTAKAIMGLVKGPSGEVKAGSEIRYRGENILGFAPKQWQAYRGGECAIVFQDALASLNPTMRVGRQIEENLIIHRQMKKKEAAAQAVELLRMVGIPEPEKRARQYPHQFSGGMRQRVMIAIAFACDPKILICDEPTTALDVTIQEQILDIIQDLQQKKGTSVILITHDLGVVAGMAKRIAVMYCGVIVEQGRAEDIFYRPKHPYTWALIRSVPRIDGEREAALESIPGTPPDLIAPPVGCPFCTRCRYCMDICREEKPEVTDFGGGHTAACWLHDPLAPPVAELVEAPDAEGVDNSDAEPVEASRLAKKCPSTSPGHDTPDAEGVDNSDAEPVDNSDAEPVEASWPAKKCPSTSSGHDTPDAEGVDNSDAELVEASWPAKKCPSTGSGHDTPDAEGVDISDAEPVDISDAEPVEASGVAKECPSTGSGHEASGQD